MQETKVSSKIKLKALYYCHVLSKPNFFSCAIFSYYYLIADYSIQLALHVSPPPPPPPNTNSVLVLSVVHPAAAAMATQVSSETSINAHQQKTLSQVSGIIVSHLKPTLQVAS